MTTRAVIDVHDGKLTLRVGADSLTFDIKDTMNLSLEAANRLYFIREVDELTDIIDNCVDEKIEEGWLRDESFLSVLEEEKTEGACAVSFNPRQETTEQL